MAYSGEHVMTNDRMDEFTARLMIEIHERYEKCEDFAATPSSILLAVANAIAKVREDMGYGNPEISDNAWERIRKEHLP